MSFNDNDFDNLVSRVDEARGHLQNGFRQCQSILQKSRQDSSNQSFDWMLSAAQRNNELQNIFKEMGTTLRNAFGSFVEGKLTQCERPRFPDNFQFYMWPGYDFSTKVEDGESRATLHCILGGGREIGCGCGFADCVSAESNIMLETATAVWFDRVLAMHETDRDQPNGLSPFVPGSTHQWVTDVVRDRKSFFNDSANTSHFTFLELGDSKEISRSESHGGGISVGLEVGDWTQWPVQIHSELERLAASRSRWPAPAVPDQVTDGQLKTAHNIRLRLYSIWLAITLGFPADNDSGLQNQFKESFANVLADVQKDLGELANSRTVPFALSPLIDRLALSDSAIKNAAPYRVWYTFPLDPTIDAAGGLESLGSFMLLTTHRLERPILYMISSWVHKIYSELRLIESVAEVQRTTQRAEAKSKQQQFAHIVQGHITTLAQAIDRCEDPILKKSGERVLRQQQFAVNMYSEERGFARQTGANRIVNWEACIADASLDAIKRLKDRCAFGSRKPLDVRLCQITGVPNDLNALFIDSVLDALSGTESWETDPRLLLFEVAETSIHTQLIGMSLVWTDSVEQGLLTYILTQSIFHAAVFSRCRAIVSEKIKGLLFSTEPPYLRVSCTNDFSAITISNRTFIESRGFQSTIDYATLRDFESRFNKAHRGWLRIDYFDSGDFERWFNIRLIVDRTGEK